MSSNARVPIRRDDAIHALVRNVVDTRYEDLPQKAVDATKTLILDSLGVAIAGSLAPGVSETLGVLEGWGGKGESTVLVSGERLPAPSSAMMNSFLMHNQEFDCVHDLAVVHAFTTVLPVTIGCYRPRISYSSCIGCGRGQVHRNFVKIPSRAFPPRHRWGIRRRGRSREDRRFRPGNPVQRYGNRLQPDLRHAAAP